MTNFDDIRPYHDDEVRPVLNRLTGSREFIDTLMSMKYPRIERWAPWLLRPFIGMALKSAFADVETVRRLQEKVFVQLQALLDRVSDGLTTSGLENLDAATSYMFISNHRDIAMDPALVNAALHIDGRDTVRIAIGDNLLTKEFTSDLMRINKSFIVKRSATGKREKLGALKQLSAYIRYSVTEDNCSVWIAQREGRAKDGLDKTEPALLKMLALSKQKEQSFAHAIGELKVVPVAVSYEIDPCDATKARELHSVMTTGAYQKREHEDLISIYQGIVGEKGHLHVAFGEPLTAHIDNADEMAAEVDRQIITNYRLHPTNILAYDMLHGPDSTVSSWRDKMTENDWPAITEKFSGRIGAIPAEQRDIVLAMYANPVCAKLALL